MPGRLCVCRGQCHSNASEPGPLFCQTSTHIHPHPHMPTNLLTRTPLNPQTHSHTHTRTYTHTLTHTEPQNLTRLLGGQCHPCNHTSYTHQSLRALPGHWVAVAQPHAAAAAYQPCHAHRVALQPLQRSSPLVHRAPTPAALAAAAAAGAQ
eukprot:1073175-Pelagomonas_calceolata.AAC.2